MSTANRLRLKAGAGRVLLALLVASAAGGVFWFRGLPDDVEPPQPLVVPVETSTLRPDQGRPSSTSDDIAPPPEAGVEPPAAKPRAARARTRGPRTATSRTTKK